MNKSVPFPYYVAIPAMGQREVSGKRVRDAFFTQDVWVCRCQHEKSHKSCRDQHSSCFTGQLWTAFDGWTSNDSNFVAFFATFYADNSNGYNRMLLGFSTFEGETSQSAQQHYNYEKYLLGLYGRSFNKVACLIDDNCNTNIAFARLSEKPIIGCARHRFNLAVQLEIKAHSGITDKVRDII